MSERERERGKIEITVAIILCLYMPIYTIYTHIMRLYSNPNNITIIIIIK